MTLRVVFVLPDFNAGGAQRVLLTFARMLDRSRFNVSVVVINGQGPWREKYAQGLDIVDLEKKRLALAFPALTHTLRRLDADIVMSTMVHLNMAVLTCKPLLKGQTCIFVREANTPHTAAKTGLGKLALKAGYLLLYRMADAIISPSKLIGRELSDGFSVPDKRIHVLRNPVDAEPIRALAVPVQRHPGPGRRFVCVGRLSEQKGYDDLLEVIAEYGIKGHVMIFGEGAERARLETMIAHKNLQDLVTLAGFNANPAPWVAGADALLLPSRWEGLPNVALEALTLGTPIIAFSSAGGIGEIRDAAKTGNVKVVTSRKDFAEAMMAMKARDGKKLQLRDSRLPEAFSLKATVAALEQVMLDERRKA